MDIDNIKKTEITSPTTPQVTALEACSKSTERQLDELKKEGPATQNNYLALQWFGTIFAEVAIFALLVYAFPLITLTATAVAVGGYHLYQFFTHRNDPESTDTKHSCCI